MAEAPKKYTAKAIRDMLDRGELVSGSTDEMKAHIEAVAEKPVNETPPEDDPKLERSWPFPFRYVDGRGKVWSGDFRNKILDLGERRLVGIMRAQLAGGMPANALDPSTTELNYMLAHMTFSLEERPDWAKDLNALLDIDLLGAIFEEVASHEATFRGRGPAAAQGKAEGGAG